MVMVMIIEYNRKGEIRPAGRGKYVKCGWGSIP
jgi:hypothetical protein